MKFTDKVNDLMKKPKTIEGNLDEVKISKNSQKGINGLDEKISYSNDNFIADLKSAITEGVPISVDGVDLERRVGKELAQEINNTPKKVKIVKKDKGLIERTKSSKIVLTEDNRQVLND